ncbi:hypothetical protein RRG08_065881 [Elysia crispata]|uniref:Uncharacterized protein n=1 Tax=Elysia crispata TaxID=231223 RepID=A0AAE0ZH11_9GAST|nr:hypothetical protein RRG08_065881 [Elysia crispata]
MKGSHVMAAGLLLLVAAAIVTQAEYSQPSPSRDHGGDKSFSKRSWLSEEKKKLRKYFKVVKRTTSR